MDVHQRILVLLLELPCLILLYVFFLVAIAAVNRSRTRRLREFTSRLNPAPVHPRLVLFKAEQFLQSLHAGSLLVAMLTGYVAIHLVGSEGVWGWIVEQYPPLFSDQIVQVFAKTLFFMAITALFLVFMQLAKALAYAHPERLLIILSRVILIVHGVLTPLMAPVKAISRSILSIFGIGLPLEFERALSAEELTEMVELSTKAGEIEQDEQEMIESVFLFADTLVEEVMTPRGDIVSISINASFNEVAEILMAEGFSRLVVIGNDLDDVKGVLLAKDLFAWMNRDRDTFAVQKILRKAFFVQHSRKIDELLKDLRRDKTHLAVVLDEHGGVDGIVTVEDLVEELVGEIADEFDHSEKTEPDPVNRDDIVVEGSLAVDDFNSRYNLSLPTGEYDTIAGYVLSLMGRIPKLGECVCNEGQLITVEGIEQNRITLIRIQRELESDQASESRQSPQLSEKTDQNMTEAQSSEFPPLRILSGE